MDERAAREYYDRGGAKNTSAVATILDAVSSRGTFGRTLDIGCGDGSVLEALRARTSESAGVDSSAAAVELTRARTPEADVVAADVQESLPFADASFDSVLMLDVIEHLTNPIAAIAEIRRVLRPGGLLAVTTPNANSPIRYLRGRKWFGTADPGHVTLYTSFTLCHLLERAGFTIAMNRIEPFTETRADGLLRALRIGGTLLVGARKVEKTE